MTTATYKVKLNKGFKNELRIVLIAMQLPGVYEVNYGNGQLKLDTGLLSPEEVSHTITKNTRNGVELELLKSE